MTWEPYDDQAVECESLATQQQDAVNEARRQFGSVGLSGLSDSAVAGSLQMIVEKWASPPDGGDQ